MLSMLGGTNKTAIRNELGKYPMIIDINKKILNYLSYLQDKDDNSKTISANIN